MVPGIVPKSHQGRVGIQTGDLGTTDATSSNSHMQEAILGPAGSQGWGSLTVGNENLIMDLGQARDQDGWLNPLEGSP